MGLQKMRSGFLEQDLRTDHEKPSGWTIFGGAERPQKSSNCVSPVENRFNAVCTSNPKTKFFQVGTAAPTQKNLVFRGSLEKWHIA